MATDKETSISTICIENCEHCGHDHTFSGDDLTDDGQAYDHADIGVTCPNTNKHISLLKFHTS